MSHILEHIFRTRFINAEELTGSTVISNSFFIGYSGNDITQIFAHATGSTILGSSQVTNNFSAGTIYSGASELSSVVSSMISSALEGIESGGSGATTYIGNGINTFTGGTSTRPIINVTALTVDSIFVSGNSNFNSFIGTGSISASTVIEHVLTPKGTLISINRDSNNIISGLTKNNGVLGIRNVSFQRNFENKITGWTVST